MWSYQQLIGRLVGCLGQHSVQQEGNARGKTTTLPLLYLAVWCDKRLHVDYNISGILQPG